MLTDELTISKHYLHGKTDLEKIDHPNLVLLERESNLSVLAFQKDLLQKISFEDF